MSSLLRTFSVFLFLCSRVASAIDLGGTLPHEAVLDPKGKYHLSWNFDDDQIVFEVSVETLGYVALGLSPNGDMTGADIVIGGVSSYADGGVYLSDCHATDRIQPVPDKSQDWTVVRGSQTNTHTKIRFWRKLDTCDEEDRRITMDTVRVIWAYHQHDWDIAKLDQGGYHGIRRGSKSILLLNPQKEQPYIPSDSYTVDLFNTRVPVPARETVYWCKAYSMHAFQQKEHIIKMEAIVQPGNEQLVHHIVLYACPAITSNHTAGQGGVCFGLAMPPEWAYCTISTIFAWAVGGGPFYLPEHVGYPVGLDDSPKLILLQTHFDNPGKRADFVDSSGLRLTFTRRLRQYDAGTLSTGNSIERTHFIPPHAEHFRTDGHCLPDCLTQGMGNVSEINVFAVFPHSHLIGTAIKLRHVRNGRELKPILVDNAYDFNYQETRVLEQESQVRHGDHLITECTYNSVRRTNVTFGGEGTLEEMCSNFMLFYPRIEMGNCHSLVDTELVARFAGVTVFPNNLTVDEPESLRGRSLEEILDNNIDWEDKRNRDRIQELITSYDNPIQANCFSLGGFPADGKFYKPPEIKIPYVEPDVCTSQHPSGAVTSSGLARSVYVIITAILLLH